ncbi:FAD-dependent oxidoreductase, partial [Salmonella enterica subsp. enterica serovar Montevideo]|nr:FAD-dependent oxidoreductase [Salmonella enterica subsp. enterica serovar Montevideo]
MHNSTDFMELDTFPERITFLGGGYISIEFASIAAKMGSEVSVIGHSDTVLKQYHQPYVQKLVKKLEDEGVTFHLNIDVNKLEQTEDGLKFTDDKGFELYTDYVVDATGRVPNVEGIGLEQVGVDYDKHGIKVNKFMQTS